MTHPTPYTLCPSYLRCSVNACPLDPDYHQHPNLEDDETRCRAQKPTRLRIVEEQQAAGNPHVEQLPFAGLTLKEERTRLRKAAFEALPEDEKARRRQIMLAARAARFGGNGSPQTTLQDSQAEVELRPASDGSGEKIGTEATA